MTTPSLAMNEPPTRDQWETRERNRIKHAMDTGTDTYLLAGRAVTDAETEWADRYLPDLVKAIRRECGRVERGLRRQFPAAWGLLNTHRSMSDYRQAENALTNDEREAFLKLVRMDRIRNEIRAPRGTGIYEFDLRERAATALDWLRDEHTSAEIDHLRDLDDKAQQHMQEIVRERARECLALVDSGQAWENELDRRAKLRGAYRGSWVPNS